MTEDTDFLQRRALVTGAAVLGAGLAAAAAGTAEAQTRPAAGAWTAEKEKLDDWLDFPAAHRFVFDCATASSVPSAMGFVRNYYVANKNDYGLDPSRLGVVIILRTGATPFGYNDVIWAKYGQYLGSNAKLIDPATGLAPTRNLYNAKGVTAPGANGVLLSDLSDRGAHFAVCATATRGVADFLAKATGGQAEAIRAELVANLIANARMVPAGIVTLNRAQERGYAAAHIV